MLGYEVSGIVGTSTGNGNLSMKFFLRAIAVPKIGLLPIFRNVDGSWRVTSKLRGSTLIQVARRRSKVFQRFLASLVRLGDVQGVSRRHAVRGKKVPHMGELLGKVEKV